MTDAARRGLMKQDETLTHDDRIDAPAAEEQPYRGSPLETIDLLKGRVRLAEAKLADRDAALAASPPPSGAPGWQSLRDMRRASVLVDESDGPQEYQARLCALAMITRQYLREVGQPERRGSCKGCGRGDVAIEDRAGRPMCGECKSYNVTNIDPPDVSPAPPEGPQ